MYLGFSHFFYEKWAGQVSEHVSGQVSGHVSKQDFMLNWNFFGLRGDFPYCKRFVLAGTKREPSKQSLWEKQRQLAQNKVASTPVAQFPLTVGSKCCDGMLPIFGQHVV